MSARARQAFLGVFIAVPLRTQTILRENLRFPSGTATAKVIRTLHGLPEDDPSGEPRGDGGALRASRHSASALAPVRPPLLGLVYVGWFTGRACHC